MWGDKERTLRKAQDRGESVPALENKPELFPDLYNVWNAFWSLNRTRLCLFAPQALQVVEITSYLEKVLHIKDIEFFQSCFMHITTLDNTWLTEQGNKDADSSSSN